MALQSCATHIHKYVWNSHVFPAPCKDSKYKKAAFWAGLLHIGNLGIASSLMASRNCPSIIPLLTTIFFCWEKSFVGPLIQKKMTWGQLALSAQTLCEFPENRKYVMAKSTLSSCSKMGGPTKKMLSFYTRGACLFIVELNWHQISFFTGYYTQSPLYRTCSCCLRRTTL